jgi:putative oxidoreductase
MTTIEREPAEIGGLAGRYRSICALLAHFPLAVIQLAMRIAVGTVFFKSGLLKFNSWEFAIKLFEDEYKVPVLSPWLAAVLATFNELTFSTLIIAGLATRLATLPLLGMIFVIQIFVYPQAWPEHLLWASILVFLLTRGPGALSLDCLVERFVVRERGGAHGHVS